ncbi:MAG: alpha-E domain-containing protein [Planctomycetota bacterium]
MLARVAETIYWMARQMERAENLSRFLEVNLSFLLDQPENLVDPWEPLVQVTGDTELYRERYPNFSAEHVIKFLAFDGGYGNSMLSSLRFARENARSVREVLSSEAFEEINDFYHFVMDAAKDNLEPTTEFFEQVRRKSLLWNGVFDATMSHDLRWHFANLGRLVERADKTSRILDVKYFNLLPQPEDAGTAVDDLQWSALLYAISGFEAYRREHHLMDINRVIEFFVFNDRFPRSILCCVAGAEWSLTQIEKEHRERPGDAHSKMNALRERLAASNVQQLHAKGMHEFIDQIQLDLNNIGDTLNTDYFYALDAS